MPSDDKTTVRHDGLNCVYPDGCRGKIGQGAYVPCHPGCFFQMSTLDLCLCGKMRGSCDACQNLAAGGAEWLRRTSNA